MEKTLEFESYLTHMPFPVKLEINSYLNNQNLYIGLTDVSEMGPEPYGDITVNLEKVLAYCGYVDINNMPELEEFIKDNDLGEFTGLTKRSGFCEYPLYMHTTGLSRLYGSSYTSRTSSIQATNSASSFEGMHQ